VQTGPGGIVRLGHLSGIRQIGAQIDAGVSHVQAQGLGLAAAGVQQGLGAAAAFSGGEGDGKGPMRTWQVARASWWQGGLQHEVRAFRAPTSAQLLLICIFCVGSRDLGFVSEHF
jgi:hypothetical protein